MEQSSRYELEAKRIYKYFGGVKALDGASVIVEKGKLTSLIGPNGSGKSTFFNVITGFLEHESEDAMIQLRVSDIENETPENIALRGMVRTFQNTRNFPNLTVLENMLISPQNQAGESIIWSFIGKRLWKRQEARNVHRALSILKFLEID
ncbi:MAG: ATP-binding cassette domain-containing protein, partial [Candidatus Kariarchaeaceae archaeon]